MYKHLVIWKLVEKADAPQVVQAAQGVLAELRSSSMVCSPSNWRVPWVTMTRPVIWCSIRNSAVRQPTGTTTAHQATKS